MQTLSILKIAVIALVIGTVPARAQGIFDDKDEEKKEHRKKEKKHEKDDDDDDKHKSKGRSSKVEISQEAGSYGYKTGIGLRGGFTSGLTLKHFISGKSAIEGIIGSRWRGFSVTGLYEMHSTPALGVPRLAWEYGLGARAGFYRGSYYRIYDDDKYYEDRSYTVLSIVGIVGLEYHFGKIPFTVSADLMPYFDFTYRGDSFIDGSLSLRYVF